MTDSHVVCFVLSYGVGYCKSNRTHHQRIEKDTWKQDPEASLEANTQVDNAKEDNKLHKE